MPLSERSSVRYLRGRLPSRYWTAWKAGEACGLTAILSPAWSSWKYRAVRIEITEDEDAWWPPILEPSRLGRTWLAWWIMLVASQSTRRWIDSSAASSSAASVP